jgi:hypothetical protein
MGGSRGIDSSLEGGYAFAGSRRLCGFKGPCGFERGQAPHPPGMPRSAATVECLAHAQDRDPECAEAFGLRWSAGSPRSMERRCLPKREISLPPVCFLKKVLPMLRGVWGDPHQAAPAAAAPKCLRRMCAWARQLDPAGPLPSNCPH